MGLLYVDENGAVIGVEANRCTVTYKDGLKRSIPIESLEGITILGRAQVTTNCMEECLKRGVPVAYFSRGGNYFGRLQSTGHVNTARQRKQCQLYDTDFAVQLAKKIINAKLKNQSVVLRRYERSRDWKPGKNRKCSPFVGESWKDAAAFQRLLAMKDREQSIILQVFPNVLKRNFILREEIEDRHGMNLIL